MNKKSNKKTHDLALKVDETEDEPQPKLFYLLFVVGTIVRYAAGLSPYSGFDN